MRSDDKYIDTPDDFSRKVGETLREHRMPVDSGVWSALTDKLPPRERRLSVHWPWAAAGAAAVAVALLLLLRLPTDEQLLTERTQSREQVEQETVVPANIEKQVEEQTEEYNNRQIENKADKKSSPKQMPESVEITKPEEFAELTAVINPEEITPPVGITGSSPDEKLHPEEPVNSEPKLLPAEELLAENHLSLPAREQRGIRSLIAALGSGGVPLDFSFGDNMEYSPGYDFLPGDDPDTGGDPGMGDGSGGEYNLLTPGDYTDIEHHPPVSFSLTADFPVGRNVSVETGLSYTYLFSRFRRNDNLVYRGTLQQHYIGIPVNLRYAIRQNKAWNVYLLGGWSIEKGLRSVYRQEIEYNGSVVHHTDVYSRIDGFQFSVQGGAGFSYRLHNNLHLFGEPKLVYYFKNNQPMSARTENPLIFGLNMGIRIQFE